MLLQPWYHLSDMGVEDTVTDHRTFSRFRSELSSKIALYELLFQRNAPLAHRGVWVQQGSIIDASITPTARQAHGKSTYILPEDPDTLSTKEIKSGVARAARWVKKGNSLEYHAQEDHAAVFNARPTSMDSCLFGKGVTTS